MMLRTLTNFRPITVDELANRVKKEVNELKTRREGDEVICPICQCDFFENVDYQSEESKAEAREK